MSITEFVDVINNGCSCQDRRKVLLLIHKKSLASGISNYDSSMAAIVSKMDSVEDINKLLNESGV